MKIVVFSLALAFGWCNCGGDSDATADAVGDVAVDTTAGDAVADALADASADALADTAADTVADSQEGPGDTVDAAEEVAPTPVDVAITAPAGDRAVVTGARTITLSGTLSGPVATLAVTLNGVAVDATRDGAAFAAELTLADGDNAVVVTATGDVGQTGSDAVIVRYPFVALGDFDGAALVLGQPDLVSGDARTVGADAFKGLRGASADAGGVLYVPDPDANRVVAFRGFPTADGEGGDFFLGQASATATSAGVGASGLEQPTTAIVADGRLFVLDRNNARVVIWNTPPDANAAPADVVVPQATFTREETGCTANAFKSGATDIAVGGGRLVLSDTEGHRLLVWSTLPTATGVAPDLVLGQGDFTHCGANDDDQDGVTDATPSARTFNSPSGLWTDGERLVLADALNHRVLVWTSFPTSSFAPADVVIGQDDFTTRASGRSASQLTNPRFVASNGNQLVVSDQANHRVLVWDAFPAANTAADHVLGQADFTHGTANDDDQDGTKDGQPSGRTLHTPRGLTFVRDALAVADAGNRRLLFFGPLPCPVNADYLEHPIGSGACLLDPCAAPDTCEPLEVCGLDDDGGATCTCPTGVAEDCAGTCVRRVNPDASGDGSGTSWADGITDMQSGIDAAAAAATTLSGPGTCEVWVTGGTHYVYATSPSDTIALRAGVTVRGGFAGTETSADERPGAAETVLDGGDGPAGANRVYHVLTATAGGGIERLTVRGGQATGTGGDARGGGLTAKGAVAITDCRFESNVASTYGGGVAFESGALVVSGTTFDGNRSGLDGGALWSSGGEISDSVFTGNRCCTDGPSGGGAVSMNGNPVIRSSTFIGNRSGDSAGAVHVRATSGTLATSTFIANVASIAGAVYYDASSGSLTTSLFVGNTSSTVAGALYVRDGDPAITGSTFVGNVAKNHGGAILGGGQCANLVIWQNVAEVGPQVYSTPSITYSDVAGGATGVGNIDADPAFLRAPAFWDRVTAASLPGVVSLSGHGGAVAVGDTVVLGEDGVARTVTAVDGLEVTFSPALDATPEVGTVLADWGPGVTDVAWDLHLGAGSACIDAGHGDVASATDLDGDPRVDDAGVVDTGAGTPTYVDLGCYER